MKTVSILQIHLKKGVPSICKMCPSGKDPYLGRQAVINTLKINIKMGKIIMISSNIAFSKKEKYSQTSCIFND